MQKPRSGAAAGAGYVVGAERRLSDAEDPVERAEYLLTLEGFDIGEQRSKDVPPELLEEVFELNMALEEMRGGDDSARPQLEQAEKNFASMLAAIRSGAGSAVCRSTTQARCARRAGSRSATS